MYAYIQGTVAEVGENTVVLDVGGVGYELNATASAVYSCAVGAVRRLPTYLVVKEDEMSLYGFADMSEKNMFLRLIAVSGIGPKLALSVLGGMSVRELSRNIASGNSAALLSIKGVGKRTAERIVVELKDKITESCDGAGDAVQKSDLPEKAEEAVGVLVALGFKPDAAVKAVTAAYKEDMTVNQIVHKAISG